MFFSMTKLFMSSSSKLRRLVYVFIKELKADENEVFIVTSCLMKDVNGTNNMHKANALRVLTRIMDAAST
jgi:coatomer protein complex subunit gamma